MGSKEKGISIIVCTRNRKIYLEEIFVRSLFAQEGFTGQCELIIVDASGADETRKYVQDLTGRLNMVNFNLCIRYIHMKRSGIVSQRICGLREARFDIIGFFDDDSELSFNALHTIQECFKDDTIGGLGLSVRMNLRIDWKEALFKRLFLLSRNAKGKKRKVLISGFFRCDLTLDPPGFAEFLSGCSMVFRKRVLEKIKWPLGYERFGGYAMGEDTYISHAVFKYQKLYVTDKATVTHHYAPGKRMNSEDFAASEVWNQYLFIRDMRPLIAKIIFIWPLTGLFLMNVFKSIKNRSFQPVKGCFAGLMEIFKNRKDNVEIQGRLLKGRRYNDSF